MDLKHPHAEAGLFIEFALRLSALATRVAQDVTQQKWDSHTTNGKWRRMVVLYYKRELVALLSDIEHLTSYVTEEDS